MKIEIKGEKTHFSLRFPLSPFFIRVALKIARFQSEDVPDGKIVAAAVKELKKYCKQNGHFVLLEMVDSDAEVKITV